MRTVIRMLSDVIEQFGHQRLHLLQPAVESGMYAQESFQPMTGYVRSKSTCTHHTLTTGFLLLMDYSHLGIFAGGPKQHASVQVSVLSLWRHWSQFFPFLLLFQTVVWNESGMIWHDKTEETWICQLIMINTDKHYTNALDFLLFFVEVFQNPSWKANQITGIQIHSELRLSARTSPAIFQHGFTSWAPKRKKITGLQNSSNV